MLSPAYLSHLLIKRGFPVVRATRRYEDEDYLTGRYAIGIVMPERQECYKFAMWIDETKTASEIADMFEAWLLSHGYRPTEKAM